jgi:hypothetical protein
VPTENGLEELPEAELRRLPHEKVLAEVSESESDQEQLHQATLEKLPERSTDCTAISRPAAHAGA